MVCLRQVRLPGVPALSWQSSWPVWAGLQMQQVSVRADEGGEIVFLYSQFLVRKRTIQKYPANSPEVGPIRWAGGKTMGAAVFSPIRETVRNTAENERQDKIADGLRHNKESHPQWMAHLLDA